MDSKGFESLDVFRRAYKVSLEIHRVSLKLPKIEQYGLAEQMRRASKSIPANLAEGYAKKSSQSEFNRFVKIAAGSTDELRVWIRYCFDLEYIDEQQWTSWKAEYTEIAKMLSGLSNSIV
jgi:four helix bundle protein